MNCYHKLPKSKLVNRKDFIISKCLGKTVLHLGACGDISFHQQLSYQTKVLGVDIDDDAIQKARALGVDNIIHGNVEDMDSLPIHGDFDVIFAGEIIEHLCNSGRFLESAKKFFSPHTRMIITTPNAYCLHRFLYSLLAHTEYVNPEHTCYYSFFTLEHLLLRHDFRITESYFWHSGLWFERTYKLLPNHVASGLIFIVGV